MIKSQENIQNKCLFLDNVISFVVIVNSFISCLDTPSQKGFFEHIMAIFRLDNDQGKHSWIMIRLGALFLEKGK